MNASSLTTTNVAPTVPVTALLPMLSVTSCISRQALLQHSSSAERRALDDVLCDLLPQPADVELDAASRALPPLLASLARCYAHHDTSRPLATRDAVHTQRVRADLGATLSKLLV